MERRVSTDASISLVWDSESADDRAAAAAVSRRFPHVRHLWEPPPPNGTLCGKMRGLGYDRQQYSNFVQDRLFLDGGGGASGGGGGGASDGGGGGGGVPEFLGFLDADTFFTAAVHPADLFEV